jgi:hypothetical protein
LIGDNGLEGELSSGHNNSTDIIQDFAGVLEQLIAFVEFNDLIGRVEVWLGNGIGNLLL